MTNLTPRLAQKAPQEFRSELIGGLERRTAYGKHLWRAVESSGMISVDTVYLESGQWTSRSNAQRGDIHLGTQPLPQAERRKLIFNDGTINYEQEISLRFLHELGHLFEAGRIYAGSNQIQTLLQTTRAIRNVNQNLGLSAIGSLPSYGPEMKFREDSSELIAMYAFRPGYLRQFLSYVDSPARSAELSSVGVAVVPGFGDELYSVVHDTVQEGIHSI
jgi:hypothetical protein